MWVLPGALPVQCAIHASSSLPGKGLEPRTYWTSYQRVTCKTGRVHQPKHDIDQEAWAFQLFGQVIKCMITLCSFLYLVLNVFVTCPVSSFSLAQAASAVQTQQGREPSGLALQKDVGLSLMRFSFISLLRESSNVVRHNNETQHLKNPPLFLHFLPKLLTSWIKETQFY